MEFTRLTPLKQELMETKRRLCQQDGKIMVLSSQLEKKRVLAEEFESAMQQMQRLVKQKDAELFALSNHLSKLPSAVDKAAVDNAMSNLPDTSTSFEADHTLVQSLLLHWQRSSSYRYVISGRDSSKDYFVGSPVVKVLQSSICSKPSQVAAVQETRCSVLEAGSKPVDIKPSETKRTEVRERPHGCPFPKSFQEKLFSPPSRQLQSSPVLPVLPPPPPSQPVALPAKSDDPPVTGIAFDRTLQSHGESEHDLLETGSLDETLVSEMDLSCYPLDATFDQLLRSPSPPRRVESSTHKPILSKLVSTESRHRPVFTAQSPNTFLKRVSSIRNENLRLQGDIARYHSKVEGGKGDRAGQQHAQTQRLPFSDISNRSIV